VSRPTWPTEDPADRLIPQLLQALSQALDEPVLMEPLERLGDALVEPVIKAIRAEGLMASERGSQAWLDAQEAAARLGVSRECVYEHADGAEAKRIRSERRTGLRLAARVAQFPGRLACARLNPESGNAQAAAS
jgi:hypothetical protein